MSAWPQQSNGLYPGMLDGSGSNTSNHIDPSMMSMYNGNNGFNPNQFNNQMSNGSINPSAFQNQTFNVGSVVPSKRPREDGMAMSPRPGQNNGMNASRSQTPMAQQNNPYQGGQPGQQFQAPNPYQHLQHTGSANATPSPTMQSQQFRQPPPPQRMATGSPATFNQMQPNMAPQMSPGPQSQNNHSMSPQPGQGQQFSPTLNGGQGFGQNFGQQGMMAGGMQGGMPGQGASMASNQQLAAQLASRRNYQQQLLQTQQRMQASGMSAQRPNMPGQQGQGQPGQMFNQQGQQAGQAMPNGQQPPPQQQPQSQQSQQSAAMQKQQQWVRSLAAHVQGEGKQLNPNPTIAGRPTSLYMIWACVIGAGGGARVSQGNLWPAVAQKLGFEYRDPQAAQDLENAHETFLASYEQIYINARVHARQHAAQQRARAMAGRGAQPQQTTPTRPTHSSPQDAVPNPYMQPPQPQAQQAGGMPTPVPPVSQPQRTPSFPPSNGMSIPSPALPQSSLPSDASMHRRSSSLKQAELGLERTTASPTVGEKATSVGPVVKGELGSGEVKPIVPEPQSTEYNPHKYTMHLFGGVDIQGLDQPHFAALPTLIPDVPRVEEMGLIDIRAIAMSLQSGIHAEVRYAIDTLAALTHHQHVVLELDKAEDLADVIMDCLEEQVAILAEEAVEVSDAVDLVPYEDVIRLARAEAEALQDHPSFGSTAWNLERAADRLVGLTTLLRNLSSFEHNSTALSEASVISIISNCIRLLGTRNMLLRSFANVADFYKDIATFLSNMADKLELPSREDALHILHFLLAFAPQPAPIISPNSSVRIAPYSPLVHRCLPLAVDSLAKLLVRQEPNRAHYRTIFSSSPSQTSSEDLTPNDLLTRAFALCICVLPDRNKGSLSTTTEVRTVEARKAVLIQAMRCADILASLLPSNSTDSTESKLARAWLESEDRWAAGLLRMAYVLSTDRGPTPQQRQQTARMGPDGRMQLGPDDQGFGEITHRGLSMLKRLVDKAGAGRQYSNGTLENGSVDHEGQDGDDGYDDDGKENNTGSNVFQLKGDPIPHRETLLGALLMPNADKVALRLLSSLYATVVP